MAAQGQHYDVALAGFGPTGSTLAGLLGGLGRSVLVVEREPEVYKLPRAVHFDHEVMRIFQTLGVADAVLPHTRTVPKCEFWSAGREVLLEMPMDRSGTDQGWASDYLFHQPSLERILREAAERKGAEVRYGALTGFVEKDDGVELAIEAADGSQQTAGARYLVGCDGAVSSVRRRAGLALEDLGFDEPWVVVDVRGAEGLPGSVVQVCDPARPTTLVPCADGLYRFEFMLRPGETPEQMLEPETLRGLLSAWLDPDAVEQVRAAVYRFHAVVARDWWRGRVGIAGDAAHQTPPFLGQGMCAGVRDAANLFWKLDLVLRGRAGPGLLATYGPERAPHVRALIEQAVAIGRVVCTQDPEAAAARDADFRARPGRSADPVDLPSLGPGLALPGCPLAGRLSLQARVRAEDGRVGRLDDVAGPGFRLLVRDAQAPEPSAAARRVLEDVGGRLVPVGAQADVDGAYARWLDEHACDAVLVRPDHYVFGSARGEAAASTLLEELGRRLASA